MEEIYRGRHLPAYAQIVLVDAEDPASLPEWPTGEEAAVLGPKGLAVATAPTTGDTLVEVRIYRGPGDPGGSLCLAGAITVGARGLRVGEPVADYIDLPWPPGPVA